MLCNLATWVRQNRPQNARRRNDRALRFDSLDDRKVLSTTASANGDFVSVLTKTMSTGDGDVYPRLSRNGSTIRSNIPVATSTRNELDPAVAINTKGWFVVAYEDVLSSSDSDVKFQVFGPTGSALTDTLSAATRSTREFDPCVSLNDFGRITVSYTNSFASNDLDVNAIQFFPSSSAGTSDSTTALSVATEGDRNEFDSSVKVASNGDIAVSHTRRFSSTDLEVKPDVRRTNGTEKKAVAIAGSSSNEDASFIDSWTRGTSVRVGDRKHGSTYFSTASI